MATVRHFKRSGVFFPLHILSTRRPLCYNIYQGQDLGTFCSKAHIDWEVGADKPLHSEEKEASQK